MRRAARHRPHRRRQRRRPCQCERSRPANWSCAGQITAVMRRALPSGARAAAALGLGLVGQAVAAFNSNDTPGPGYTIVELEGLPGAPPNSGPLTPNGITDWGCVTGTAPVAGTSHAYQNDYTGSHDLGLRAGPGEPSA